MYATILEDIGAKYERSKRQMLKRVKRDVPSTRAQSQKKERE